MYYLMVAGALFLMLVVHILWKQKHKPWCHLPGPGLFSPLLFIIMSVFTSNNTMLLRRLYNKYKQNGLCVLHLGKVSLLLVGDFSKIKNLCSHPGSQGRFIVPNGLFYNFIHDFRMQQPGRISGVLASQGDLWKTQKAFLVKTISSFSVTHSSLDDMKMGEVESFCHFLREKNGGAVQGVGLFNLPVMRFLWGMSTGEKLEYDDEKLHLITEGLHLLSGFLGTPSALFSIIFPSLMKTLPNLTEFDLHKKFYSILTNSIQKQIDQHKKVPAVKKPRDIIDHFLVDMVNNTDTDVEDQEDRLRTLIIDIVAAGGSATSNVLSFGFLLLVANPEVQRKVQDEIESVIGSDCPTLGHKKEMPYTQATILEILRYADIAPLDYRCTTEDVRIDDIIIPKDTIVFNIVTEVMKGSYWTDGDTFNPSRFLDGSILTPLDERLIPFLMGKRNCPGQNLAKMQLFLYFTRILKLYHVQPEEEEILPETTFVSGLISSPRPYKLRFCLRKSNNEE